VHDWNVLSNWAGQLYMEIQMERARQQEKEKKNRISLFYYAIQPVTQVLVAQRHEQEDTEPQQFGPV
jgi:hypothetical protein